MRRDVMKAAPWVAAGLFVLVGQLTVFSGTASAQSDACRVGQELDPGDYCTVDIPGINVGTNRFEVTSEGRGCYGGICAGRSLNLSGFEASRITGTSRWRIDAVPGGGGGTNRPPRATGSVPAQTLRVGGGAASVNVSRYFTDPDGDRLTYTARSSRSGVVRASASGSTVTLTPVAAGTTTVTVTARDPDGESATQSIAVTVEGDGGTSDTFGVGERIPTFPRGSAALSGSFRNASVQLSGGIATVTIGAGGYARYSDYTYTCTVSECVIVDQEVRRGIVRRESSGGGTNRPPRAVGSIPARTLTVGSAAVSVNVAPYFTDPDGDALTYSASSNRTGIVGARASGSTVTLTPRSPGVATVAVTARDSGGLSATQSIAVTVQAAGGVGGFTDDPLVPGVTPVRAVHFRELRTRIDALRTGAGLSGYAWTDRALTPGVTRVRSVHLTELRSALNQAYAAAGQPRPTYRDAGVRAGTTPIRAVHLTELRAAVVELENAAPTGLMPDLVVGSPTVTDSTLAPGQSFTLSTTVRNRGSARAAATTLRYYRSTDSRISSSDTAVGTDGVSALAAGASGAESIGLTAPSSAGTYYYGACVEPVSEESDTGNNCSAGVRVTVESGGGGDAITGRITTCSGVRVAGDVVNVTIGGTVTARRALSSVTVTATANGQSVGTEFLFDMSAGQTKNFLIFGTISTGASRLTCRVQVRGSTVRATGESISASATGPVR